MPTKTHAWQVASLYRKARSTRTQIDNRIPVDTAFIVVIVNCDVNVYYFFYLFFFVSMFVMCSAKVRFRFPSILINKPLHPV